MGVYSLLFKYRGNPHAFEKTEEFEYFIKNREVLNKIPRFDFLYNKEGNEFDVIRACIIIQSYFNKTNIEQEIETISALMHENKIEKNKVISILKEKIVDLPYVMIDKLKVYVPIFNIPLNIIYTKHPEKLLKYPYNQLKEEFGETVIDLFDEYGSCLYNSYFTRLVKISSKDNQTAFFNYDTNMIYVINDQGRLDNQIALFDKFLKKPHINHMLERLRPVMDCYFNKTKLEFIESLKENDFISDKMYNIIKRSKNA